MGSADGAPRNSKGLGRRLLLDADSFTYSLAIAHTVAMPWTSELWTYKGDLAGAKLAFRRFLDEVMERCVCTDLRLALSDTNGNFRKQVLPAYKSGRNHVQRPLLFKPLRDYMREELGAVVIPLLEGDDLVSMWATEPGARERGDVVCSIDKDCRGIPGRLYNPMRDGDGVLTILPAKADEFWMTQTLTGDRTDGYPGCPGIGPKRAERVMLADDWWPAIVAEYLKAGATEQDALANARCARLLRYGDYVDGTIMLWHPVEGVVRMEAGEF